MITDLEADKLADEYPNASPERKPQIETALRTWVTAAEAEASDRAREGAARLRQSFKSVSDLGGLWTKEQELRLPPTDNPDEVKARVANTAFLAEAGGMDYDTATKTYEGLRARWAQATLGKKDAGDLEMYAEVSRQYQDGEDKAKLAFQRDADAASRGFQRALEGTPPDWSTPESEWRKGAEKAPGFDANWGFGLEQSVAYRDAFQRAFKVATEHRPLVLETLDTLKRGTKWINQGAGLSEEAAARLMELPDAERADVLRAIVAGAASMSPEDPGSAVSNLQKVFKNMGISASRGLDALRLSKVSQALSAADAASALEAIKDGKPVYDLGGGKIATSLAAVQGAFGLEVSMQAADPVPASEIPALTKKLEGTLKFYQITNQLEQVSRQYLDPIRPAYKTGPGWVAETMAVGLAGSAPQMVAGAIPGVGLPWMTASFVDSAYERIVADQPDIDPRSALAMATVAGTIEGGIEMLQIRNAVGLLPATSRLVQAIRTPNVKLFKALGIQLGANIAEQNLEEALQDLALPTVKAIGAALNKDIEGVNWAQEWQEFGGTRLETFLSVLPLAILGAGAAGIRETTAFRNLLASEQALVEYGLPREVAASIASQETPEARQAVFFEEQSKRTPESIRAGIAEAEARVARETVAATSNETPTMVYEGGKFRIVEPDGSSSMAFDDAETASLALQSRNEWEESGAAVAVRELADWLNLRDSDKRKWEVVPKIVTLEDDTLATPEQIAERMQLAGLEGLAPSEAQVFGQNVTDVRDGMVRVVNSVFIDSNPFDVIEEEVHFRFRQERDAGIITREEAEAAVRSFQGEKAPQTFSDQALEEAVAEMGRAYFGGNFRFIQNVPQSVRSFFLRMAKFFRETFRNAAKLKRLIREGKIDANWVAFLNRSVGLTEAVQEQQAAMNAAQEIIGQPAEIVTRFSIGARQVSETDRKYLDAVNRGDMEAAQRMVDEAAEGAGFKVLYHGTTAINKAAIERSGILRPDAEPAVYLTTDPSGAGYGDGSVIRLAVPESKIEIDDEFPDGREDYRAEVGYKGSLRIKSADPVTRDDAGNVIPLSQRFNLETPDIRFSVGKKKAPKEEVAIDERHLNLAPAEYIGGRGTVSTRVPTAKKAVESQEVLHINLEAVNQSEELKAKLAQNLRDGVQEGGRSVKYLTDEQAAGTDDEVIRHFIDLVKSNLLWLWDKFPEEYKERAKLWYVGANKIAEACAEFYGVTVEQAAGVLAVESPQKDWFQNVSMAERIMRIWKRAMKEDFVFTQERFDYCYNNDVEEVKAVAESEFKPRIFKPKKWSKRSGVSEEEFNASEEQRKKDHRKKERERKSAFLEKREEARVEFIKKNAKWEAIRPRVVGKPWSQLDYDGKARLFRALDEMEGDRSYRIILPEGGRGEIALTSKGEPAVVAWSSYNFIAKAFSILDDGSLENISRNLGEEHKVRNFFNNISDPHNAKGYVTIDTHAIAAALLNSLSGTSKEVKDNFGAAGGDSFVGVGGTYGIYATAYKELADELSRILGRQVLAREVQSVTWEAVRLLFTKEQKTSGKLTQQLDALWNEHAEGKSGIDDVRRRIWDLSGGIQPPSWANTEFGYDAQQSGVAGNVLDGGPFIPLGRRAGGADTSMDPREGSLQQEGVVRGSDFQRSARFSVGRRAAPYAEQLAAQMDALKTKPTVRIQIYERARKKFTDLVARHRAALAEAQAADTRKPAEIIEEAKATHDAEVEKIDAERDAALAEATTEKQRNTARLVHGTKLRAANLALSKALAAATGEGTRQARTAQVVGELNAILSAFPAEVRGRVGGFVQLASLKTETGRANELSRRLSKAETELEKLLRKEYRAQLDRVLDSYLPQREAGKKPKGKIGAQAQEILDAAEAAMIMDATDVAALVAKYDLLANDPDASPEDVIKNGTIRDILPLLGDIKNADSARLVSAIDAVKLVGSEGWARWKFQQLQLKEDREIARKGLVQDTGKTGVRAERVEAEKNSVSVAGKSLTALLNLSSFSQVVDYLFGAESKFGAEFKKREMEASNQLEDKMDSLNTAISDLFTEMAGGVVDGERLHYKLSQRSIKTDQGEFSELEALTAVLMWMQEDGKRHMIGKLDENGQPAGAWHYNQDFVDALTKSLSPEAVKVMDWLRKQYDAEHAELNPLYQKRHGVSLPKHENYSPISANPQQTKLGQTVDPVSGAPVSGSILTPGSLRSRSLTAVAEPNFRDALKVFLAHKRSMEHWAAYYDLAVDAQAILAHRDVTNAVDAKAGPEGKTVLTGWLNYFAQGGIREAAASLSISRQLSRMLGRASMMALFGRASTVMVQSTQLAAASVKMPLGAYVLRLSKLMSGQLGWGDAIKSEFIQRRIKQAPAIVQQAMQALGDAGKPNLIKHAARQVGKLITGADALFTAGTYAILLDYHKGNAAELNLTGQEADRFAHDQAAQDTEAVAQPTRAANRSLAELTATHPMARLGWSFASEARQKIALTAWAVQGGNAAQVSKTMILTFIVGGLFTQILKNLWREMKGDDDEEKWSAKRLAIASVTGPLNGIPGFNALTGDGGTLFSKLKQTGRAVESLLDGEQSAAQVVQGMNTLLSAMGLFSDNAAALSVMGNVATDAAKLLQNVSGEKTSSK